jgi:hypothetical protein
MVLCSPPICPPCCQWLQRQRCCMELRGGSREGGTSEDGEGKSATNPNRYFCCFENCPRGVLIPLIPDILSVCLNRKSLIGMRPTPYHSVMDSWSLQGMPPCNACSSLPPPPPPFPSPPPPPPPPPLPPPLPSMLSCAILNAKIADI